MTQVAKKLSANKYCFMPLSVCVCLFMMKQNQSNIKTPPKYVAAIYVNIYIHRTWNLHKDHANLHCINCLHLINYKERL
jgi:hypothetical protein